MHNGLVGERFSVGGGVYWLGKGQIDITASLFGAFNPLEESNLFPKNDFNNVYQCLSFGSRACAGAIRIFIYALNDRSQRVFLILGQRCLQHLALFVLRDDNDNDDRSPARQSGDHNSSV